MKYQSALVVSVFCLQILHSFAQNDRHLSSSLDAKGDTLFYYRPYYGEEKALRITHLDKSKDSFHFRYWLHDQVIDIWTNSKELVSGQVLSYTKSEQDNSFFRKSKLSVLYMSRTVIDTAIARIILSLMKEVIDIPTDDSIEGWRYGDDGETYILQALTAAGYSLKTYWTPSAQDTSILEVRRILKFRDTICSILALDSLYESFFKTLKPGRYQVYDYMARIKYSRWQEARLNRQKEKYKASQ